jgi:hypothetical protein
MHNEKNRYFSKTNCDRREARSYLGIKCKIPLGAAKFTQKANSLFTSDY